MIKCIVVDDEPLARSLIEGHIKEVPFLELVGSFKNAVLASEFLSKNAVDLIFLDIQMPMLSGMEFLRSLGNPPQVIFTTAYREYALESYELQVADYLLKPITFARFFKAVSKLKVKEAQDSSTNDGPDHLFVKINKKHLKVVLDEILYAESMKDYLKIHLKDDVLVIKQPISSFIKSLPKEKFLQVHRSYVVALDKITAFTQQDVEIGEIEIPIGGLFKERVIDTLQHKKS